MTARLPNPGSDDGTWGDILNDFLSQSLNSNGSLKTSAVAASGAEQITSKGAANGYAGLDGSTKIPIALLPATALSSDSDVTITSPVNNQVLTYNSGSGKWINQTSASGVALDSNPADIQPLGAQAAGSTGKAADASHVHAMPTLNQVSHPTTSVSLNSQKITSLANGTVATDAAAFGQIPTSLPPNGTAGGDLTGTYPNPTVTATANFKSQVETVRLDQMAEPASSVDFNGEKITGIANGTASTDAAAFGQIPTSAGSVGGLLAANNLSDVANANTSRSNLSAAQWFAPTVVKTGSYTAAPGDFVPVDTTSGSVAITLPTTPADKTRVGVKMIIQGSTNTVSVTAGGSDVFNKVGGGTSLTLTLLNQGALLQYAASTGIWYVQADDFSLAQLDTRYLNQSTTGSAAKWTTARLLAGNSVDGSANVPFANKFIAQGTSDSGLSGAQFLGALSTGIMTVTTSTGVVSSVAAPAGTIVGTSDTQTVSNKRVTRRVVTVTQSATPAINTDNTDVASITGLAQAITSMTTSLTGTPVDGDMLIIRITDNGTARAITWGASFESSTVTLPAMTVISTMLMVGFAWNTATSKWRCIAVA